MFVNLFHQGTVSCLHDSAVYHNVGFVHTQGLQNPGAVGDNQKTSVPALLVLLHALGHGSYRIHVQTGIRLIQYGQTGI